jgi:hypothetical protein
MFLKSHSEVIPAIRKQELDCNPSLYSDSPSLQSDKLQQSNLNVKTSDHAPSAEPQDTLRYDSVEPAMSDTADSGADALHDEISAFRLTAGIRSNKVEACELKIEGLDNEDDVAPAITLPSQRKTRKQVSTIAHGSDMESELGSYVESEVDDFLLTLALVSSGVGYCPEAEVIPTVIEAVEFSQTKSYDDLIIQDPPSSPDSSGESEEIAEVAHLKADELENLSEESPELTEEHAEELELIVVNSEQVYDIFSSRPPSSSKRNGGQNNNVAPAAEVNDFEDFKMEGWDLSSEYQTIKYIPQQEYSSCSEDSDSESDLESSKDLPASSIEALTSANAQDNPTSLNSPLPTFCKKYSNLTQRRCLTSPNPQEVLLFNPATMFQRPKSARGTPKH